MSSTEDMAARLSALLGRAVPAETLTPGEAAYLGANLHRMDDVGKVWAAMDAAWEAEGAGFAPGPETEGLGRFYGGPVWLLNGLFTETDPESRAHREAILAFVRSEDARLVADHGGGFGALARRLAAALPETRVRVVEPWPHPLALHLAGEHPNLAYAEALPAGDADIVIAQDVLEHVTDPLADFARLLDAVRVGGAVIAANCFQPVIHCHYPGALHFHFSFTRIAPRLGCRFEGGLPGAGHAHVFRKTGAAPDWAAARRLERLSRLAFPALSTLQGWKRAALGRRAA